MSTNVLRVPARRAAAVRTSSRAIFRALQGFCRPYRRQVARMAARHPALADLAVTFPGLLFALAVPRPGTDPSRAVAVVIDCAPLKAAASAAGVPYWLRRLPPQAFAAPIATLPDGEGFRCRIANHLPQRRSFADSWLDGVAFAAQWSDAEFALWVASLLAPRRRTVGTRYLPSLALYAWYSRRPDTAAHRLIRKPWTSDMTGGTACSEAAQWQENLQLRLALGDRPLDPWHAEREVAGFEFVPLRTRAEISEEASVMRNCLCTYGYVLAGNSARVWSVRRQGERVATLSIGVLDGRPFPDIRELRARENAAAPKEVWLAARDWFDRSKFIDMTLEVDRRITAPHRGVWIELWKPYWLAKRRIPSWLPLVPTRDTLDDL
jgi:hypothetical protein